MERTDYFDRVDKYRGTSIQGTHSGPTQVSSEWRLGWGLLIIKRQQMKYFSFILPRNLLQSLFQEAR